MNFKRPCWISLYVTFGMMLLGYCGFLSTASYWADKQATRGWWILIGTAIGFLLIFGTLGFLVSLIWCLVEAIASRSQTDRPKS